MTAVKRFLDAANNNTEMKTELKALKGIASIVSYARGKGVIIRSNSSGGTEIILNEEGQNS